MDIKVGLEIHVYVKLDNKQKLFCTCLINPSAEPNTTICERCTGQPGAQAMLPNKEAVEKVVKTCLMLNCRVNQSLVWQRKHYDWPDLPKGYQTTMSGSYAVPVGEDGEFYGIKITEAHLEEDPARWDPVTGCIDYNRSGYPLIEIVTAPDFDSPDQVRGWLKKLMTTLSYLKVVDSSMGLKCDVNVSVSPKFDRVEIKNVNSFSSIINAIAYESVRQRNELADGKEIRQQTRQWSDVEQVTKFMRSKEQALDYMFIPDPDLPVVKISKSYQDKLFSQLPDKPRVKMKKMLDLGVDPENAQILSNDLLLADLFEKLASEMNPVFVSRWMRNELLKVMNFQKKSFDELKINPDHLIELLLMLYSKEITDETGREILYKLSEESFSPNEYVQRTGSKAIKDSFELERFCREAIDANSDAVKDFKSGKLTALNFLVGQVMRKTKGKAKPDELKKIFESLLK